MKDSMPSYVFQVNQLADEILVMFNYLKENEKKISFEWDKTRKDFPQRLKFHEVILLFKDRVHRAVGFSKKRNYQKAAHYLTLANLILRPLCAKTLLA